ncbi:DUF3299 domain-containing protein [Marinobacterium lutimaris]|uniref:DUF3299 domain-containing protein n=1 Tax=Marinobacterium lutimaris TaxID=568106 RepID=A0A1H5YLH3_9GAMM|nr:DUF3299 domain-containing protein [Marinobacterium lutimaris]SEG24991.1 hypothetical protein SAMN05444390_1011815 [Marinobacterium lutimaris]
MKKLCRLTALLLPLLLISPVHAEQMNGEEVREITWDDLMPADYNLSFEDLYGTSEDNLDALDDYTEEASNLLDHMQQVLASAPVVDEMDGKMVRVPGFVVPLEGEDQRVDRFFLVPYFGACIHTPPPPSNQIIDTHYEPGTQLDSLYDAVWITGKLTVHSFQHEMGTAGYRLEAFRIEPYEMEEEENQG